MSLLTRRDNAANRHSLRCEVSTRCRTDAWTASEECEHQFLSTAQNYSACRKTTSLRSASPTYNSSSRGNHLPTSLQNSHLNIRYYHQDLHQEPFNIYAANILPDNFRAPLLTTTAHRYLCCGMVSAACLSAIHFRGCSIRQVSCYTLLSGFQLP